MARIDKIRSEIDGIDDEILDLLNRRAGLVGELRSAEKSPPPLAPAREARILRRLVERHAGAFPALAVVRIWRELISAMAQGAGDPFAIAVTVPAVRTADEESLWDIARDHFGSQTELVTAPSPLTAIRLVTEGKALAALVPWEESEPGQRPWWTYLAGGDGSLPSVIARLPFVAGDESGTRRRDGLLVAEIEPMPTGEDRSLVVIEHGPGISTDRLRRAIEEAGFRFGCFCGSDNSGGARLHLVEMEGFVANDDARFESLAEALENGEGTRNAHHRVIGAYAKPLRLAAAAADVSRMAS
jgi:chorismate mutase